MSDSNSMYGLYLYKQSFNEEQSADLTSKAGMMIASFSLERMDLGKEINAL